MAITEYWVNELTVDTINERAHDDVLNKQLPSGSVQWTNQSGDWSRMQHLSEASAIISQAAGNLKSALTDMEERGCGCCDKQLYYIGCECIFYTDSNGGE